jgi:hypothetical protein
MVALLQALEIIFEIQRKKSNEKITRTKISFPTYKNALFFFPLNPKPYSKVGSIIVSLNFRGRNILATSPLDFWLTPEH